MTTPIPLPVVALWFILAVLCGIIIGASALALIQRSHRRRLIIGRNTFIHRI